MTEYLIPGGDYVKETLEGLTYLIPGGDYINEGTPEAAFFDSEFFDSEFFETQASFGPSVVDQFISHDAVLVRIGQHRDVVAISFGNSAATPPSVFDALAASEDVRVQIGVTPSVADAVAGTDVANALIGGLSVFVQELGAPAEMVQAFLNILTVVVHDDTPAAEDARVAVVLEVIAIDSNPVTDVVSLLLGLQVVDVVTVGEAVAVQMPIGVSAADVVAPAEVVAGEFNVILCAVSDNSPVGELAALHRNFIIQVSDTEVVEERRFVATARVKKVKVRPV